MFCARGGCANGRVGARGPGVSAIVYYKLYIGKVVNWVLAIVCGSCIVRGVMGVGCRAFVGKRSCGGRPKGVELCERVASCVFCVAGITERGADSSGEKEADFLIGKTSSVLQQGRQLLNERAAN